MPQHIVDGATTGENIMATYEIQNINTGKTLANNLTAEQVDAWWSANQNDYFGEKVVGNTILVSNA